MLGVNTKIVTLALSALVFAGCDQLQNPDKAQQNQSEQTQANAVSLITISLQPGNQLSVNLKNAPLSEVAAELSRVTKAKITLDNQKRDEKVTIAFSNIPLKIGIQRIFGDNTIVEFPSGKDKALPKSLLSQLLPGNTQKAEEETLTDRASAPTNLEQLIDQALNGQEPGERILALDKLAPQASKAPEKIVPVFESALQDNDPQVRKKAINLVLYKRVPVSSETLHDVAVNDEDDELRGKAWVELASRGNPEMLKRYLPDALSDPNPDIRKDAKNLLEKLEAKNEL